MRERFGRLGAELRSRARDQARWLIRDHGDNAEAVLAGKMRRASNSAADRYRYRCAARELERLRAFEAQEARTALVVWQPSLLSRLFGGKSRRRR